MLNLIHYLHLALEFGSLKQLWYTRFKGKHQDLRDYHTTFATKNLCYILSKKHQVWQCWAQISLNIHCQLLHNEGEQQILLCFLSVDIQEGSVVRNVIENIPNEVKLGVISFLTNKFKYKVNGTIIMWWRKTCPSFMKIAKIIEFQYYGFSLADHKMWIVVVLCHYISHADVYGHLCLS